MTDDDMGKGKLSKGGGSLTEDDFKHISHKWNMNVSEIKKNTFEALKKQVGD